MKRENTYKRLKICVVDDEEIIRITLSDELKDSGHEVFDFDNPIEALDFIKHNEIQVLLTDIKMPQMDGITLLKKVLSIKPNVYVITITAYGSLKTAIEAIKLGAFDYLTKPYDQTELENILDNISELISLKKSNKKFSNLFTSKYSLSSYQGQSDFVRELKEDISLIANKNTAVLITGETGTGKELVANIIHYNSNRRNNPLIKISCAILSKDVFESELFGHEKGAFTGADKLRIGRFEQADGGTILLDDIDDIPLELQVKLLRVLQEGEIERVGGNKTISIDVRIIASTKKDLKELVAQGRFREDLYYRLNIYPIILLPIRKRKEDIRSLFDYFLVEFGENSNFEVDEEVYANLYNYDWPGNVRELKNLAERLTIVSLDKKIDLQKLPVEYRTNKTFNENNLSTDKTLPDLLSNLEIKVIKDALEKTSGNKNKAAELLGIPISTLRSKIEKYFI